MGRKRNETDLKKKTITISLSIKTIKILKQIENYSNFIEMAIYEKLEKNSNK